uniref:MIP22513p n=1 Tax=Drosophila melanogaster TaxID=7227 RepID=D6W4S8_DROME|nr:MIP22513p [Drosophila melanogaster]
MRWNNGGTAATANQHALEMQVKSSCIRSESQPPLEVCNGFWIWDRSWKSLPLNSKTFTIRIAFVCCSLLAKSKQNIEGFVPCLSMKLLACLLALWATS